jgi:hypothetical protein
VTAGAILLLCAVLTIVAIAHHPVIAANSPNQVMTDVVRLGAMDRIVHGVLIVVVGALLYSFSVFSLRRGLHDGTVAAALVAYAIGSAGMIGAALIDGFFVPDFASRFADATPAAAAAATPLLLAGAVMIQILTKLGIIATSLAIVLWSIALFRSAFAVRIVAVAGCIAGLLPVILLTYSISTLTPHNLLGIIGAQALWYAAIGVLLIRRDL